LRTKNEKGELQNANEEESSKETREEEEVGRVSVSGI